ncbi:ABC transporter ATP-binding protein [Yinghuangia sp. ASG 101]|uniref:ABC transporter ATP-binding protein n=1 Tax=Yinghuangia sp. ASG 101 TaxID=2896848 RepID=UPI001E494841|nr:ABC transporter ATP-binding protein [Yinghuangia sp. ASG 101]UGQ15070.1 ABC transporter ATP-binding protein [Yinghuangia sp. ASG 101]
MSATTPVTGSPEPAAPSAVLRAEGVGVAFGGIRALHDVTVEVRTGEVCGLIGPNGAGKTTLFDVLSGIRRPDTGVVRFAADDVSGRGPVWRARHGVRRTFQRQQLFGRLTVRDNLVVAAEWRGGGGGVGADLLALPGRRRRERERRARAEEILELCGLTRLRDVYAGTLPVGQARMVELARAVVDTPKVLLLDEPASGMSAAERMWLAEVVRRLADQERCAVLLVEHDVAFVMGLASRVVVLNLGEVLAEGSPAEVRAEQAVRDAYLGTG